MESTLLFKKSTLTVVNIIYLKMFTVEITLILSCS